MASVSTEKARKSRAEQLNTYLADARNKTLFVSAVTVLFLIFFLLVGVIPAVQAVLTQHSENGRIQEVIEKAEQKITDLQQLRRQFEEYEQAISVLQNILPAEVDQVGFSDRLFSHAESTSVFVSSLQFSNSGRQRAITQDFRTSNVVDSVRATVVFEGARDGVVQFMNALEQERFIMHVASVSLTRKTGNALSEAGLDREYDGVLTVDFFVRTRAL